MLKLATKFAPTAEAWAMAGQAGFAYAELWTDEQVLADWRSVVELARTAALELALHFPNRKLTDPRSLKHLAQLYRALDCQTVVIHQPLYDAYAAALAAIDPCLALAVENHRLSPAELRHWAERNPALTLDVEHLWQYTLPDATLDQLLAAVRDFLAGFGHKLLHIHLPGYQPGQAVHRPMYCSRDMVFGVFALLDEFDYRGFVVSELKREYQAPNELRMDVLLFDTWQQQYRPARA